MVGFIIFMDDYSNKKLYYIVIISGIGLWSRGLHLNKNYIGDIGTEFFIEFLYLTDMSNILCFFLVK